ncbi:MAG: iron ABC transporter permease [Verrucomicrobiota bacterium]
MTRSRSLRLACIIVFFAIVVFLGMACGPTGISIPELTKAVSLHEWDSMTVTVFRDIRLPRVLLGITVGAGLAISGAVLQAFFRNPLADPGLIGISSGAALGAVIHIRLTTLGFSAVGLAGSFGLPLFAFAAGIITTGLIYLLARLNGRIMAVTFLLCGIAVNALMGAFISYLIFQSDDRELRSITFWMMGSLGFATWKEVLAVQPLLWASLVALPWLGKPLNLYILGEVEAEHLGVNVDRLKRWIILLCAACVGAGVAVTGMVGFVGLVIPHITRMLLGADHRWVLPGSAIAGGGFLVFADLLARNLTAPVELPLGVITAAFGAPFFIWLIYRERRRIFF